MCTWARSVRPSPFKSAGTNTVSAGRKMVECTTNVPPLGFSKSCNCGPLRTSLHLTATSRSPSPSRSFHVYRTLAYPDHYAKQYQHRNHRQGHLFHHHTPHSTMSFSSYKILSSNNVFGITVILFSNWLMFQVLHLFLDSIALYYHQQPHFHRCPPLAQKILSPPRLIYYKTTTLLQFF